MSIGRVALIFVAAVAVVAWLWNYTEVFGEKEVRGYEITEMYLDTGLGGKGHSQRLTHKRGRVVMFMSRGAPHAKFSSAHPGRQEITIELPYNPTPRKIIVGQPELKIRFTADYLRCRWNAEKVRGHLHIASANSHRIIAKYRIVIDATASPELCLFYKDEVVFEGWSVFLRTPRPNG